MRVLILNHPHEKCGVYQFGKRLYELCSKSEKVEYSYRIVSNKQDYINNVQEVNPHFIIYNWHFDRMAWLSPDNLQAHRQHYFIWHDGSIFEKYDKYLFFGDLDPKRSMIPEDKRALLPRPLLEYTGEYSKNKKITIGSFGFGAFHKGFEYIVTKVNQEFQEARINFHITVPYFGDPANDISRILYACRKSNKNPFIQLDITTEFISDKELLDFLASNDINVFYYEQTPNPGISSALDYALSVKRPLAVNNNSLFRHVAIDEILLEKNTIQQIINKGTQPLERFYNDWSTTNFTISMDNLFI